MGFAGLWEHWLGADGSEIESMAILTTEANSDVASIHDRMPVILPKESYSEWLDCLSGSSLGVKELMRPLAEGRVAVRCNLA